MLLKSQLDLTSLSLEEKAAQMVMIDIPGLELSAETRAHLGRHPFNGVILFAKNVRDRQQVVRLVEDIRAACAHQPLLTVDQEGGLVDRFRFSDMSLTPGNMALSATGDTECTRQAHRIMGAELKALGIDLDFAPCLDVNNNPLNPIIGVRSFGEDPHLVARHGKAAIEGLREGGVGSTAKHFPGHGDTSLDSHIALPTVTKSREELEAIELVPFRAAVEAQVDAIMTAHMTFPALDPRPGIPATLSHPTLTGLLREEMGYQGVIFTDSMAMQAVADHFGVAEGAVLSVEAGADVVLACGTFEDQVTTVQALVDAVRSGRLTEARLDESVRRIFALKSRYHNAPEARPSYDAAAHRKTMQAIVERTITVVRNDLDLVPLRPEQAGKVLVLTPDLLPVTPLGEMESTESLTKHLQLPGLEIEERMYHVAPTGPPARELIEAAAGAGTVVMAIYARNRLSDLVRELVAGIAGANPRVILVSLSSPYLLNDVPAVPAYVVSYNYTPLSLTALGQVLCGQLEATGTLPVNL